MSNNLEKEVTRLVFERNLVFAYACTPSCGFRGMSDGGFSVEICSNGSFIYKTYIFDKNEKSKREITLPLEVVGSIEKILADHAGKIENMSNRLDNGSRDGSCNRFVFFQKEIIDYNISFHDEEIYKKQNSTDYDVYENVRKQENVILQIFDLVVEKLKCADIELTLYDVHIK